MLSTIIYVSVFTLVLLGLYEFLVGAITHAPINMSGTKTLIKISQQKRTKNFWLREPWSDLLKIVAKNTEVFMTESKIHTLTNQLSRINSPYTPSEYLARTYCVIIAGIIASGILLVFNQSIIAIFVVAIAGWLCLKYNDEVVDETKRLDASIRKELPQFVRTIAASMSGERDLINVIRRYTKIAGPDMKRELDILIMDMNTGNAQFALQSFDSKLNMPEISRLTAILINIERGIDQSAALVYLASDMSLMAREDLKLVLSKRPGQMKKAMIPCAIIAVLSIFYVFVASTMETLGNIF